MNIRRIAAITAAGAVAAAGTGVAIGATSGEKAEREVLADAAKRLDTTPEKLRDALAAALDAQIDRAVKSGRITEEQGERIKAARERSGRVLGMAGARRAGRGMFGAGPHRMRGAMVVIDDVAKALGLTREQLIERHRDGKTVADVAKEQGKSLDELRRSVRAAVKARLDRAVADGDLTARRRDRMLEHLDEHLERLGEAGGRRLGRHRGGPPGPPPEMP